MTEPSRAVFTERLKTFFEGCNTWSCSSEESLPEKLLKLRREMQESIGYPPLESAKAIARMHAGLPEERIFADGHFESDVQVDDHGMRTTIKIVPPEELLSWKGLQTKSLEDLSPIVRNAWLDMASRILGIGLRYDFAVPLHPKDGQSASCVDTLPSDWGKHIALCPFSTPSRLGILTKGWIAEDVQTLRHTVHRHMAVTAAIALIAGIVIGTVLTPSGNTTVITPYSRQQRGYHHEAYAERQYGAPHVIASIPQPSRSALVPQSAQGLHPAHGLLHPAHGPSAP